jgi:hypothetical protein
MVRATCTPLPTPFEQPARPLLTAQLTPEERSLSKPAWQTSIFTILQ